MTEIPWAGAAGNRPDDGWKYERLAEDIASRYLAGATIREIAGEVGVARKTVRRALEQASVQLRRSGPRPGPRPKPPPEGGWKHVRFADDAASMRRDGMSIRQIGSHLNIAEATVRMALMEAEMKLHRRR